MSCLTQHKTKEELSNWLMENASDNETTGFLDMLAGEIWDMKKENKKLERANEINADLHKTMEETIGKLENENKKLKEKNEKWEYWGSEVIHWSHSASLDNLEAKKLITGDNKPTIAHVRDFGKEIAKLVELHNLVSVQANADNEELQSFIKEQEKEIEELKSNLDYDPEQAEIVSKDYIKKLNEENKELQEYQDKWSVIIPSLAGDDWEDLLNDYGWTYDDDGEIVRHSDEEDDIEDNDPEEYGEYTWKEGLTAEEIAKGDTIDALTGEPIEK